MSVLSKFQRSWALAKLCLGVLGRNKKLLVFPIVTFCFWMLILGLFIAPVVVAFAANNGHVPKFLENLPINFSYQHSANGFQTNASTASTATAWVIWIAVYVGAMFVATFSNVAFYHEILAALREEPVSIHSGFNFALSRLPTILFWSLFAGIIGLIIRAIEERVGWIGRLVMSLFGAAWSVACIFVIPVLVESETSNPVTALKRSASILIKTWGESIIGFVGLNFGNTIMGLGTLLVIGACVAAGILLHTLWIPLSVAISWIVLLIAYSYVMGVAAHIYRGALYLYATEQQAPAGFSASHLNDCWKHKKA